MLLETVQQEQFTYEFVIPSPLTQKQSYSNNVDSENRSNNKENTLLSSALRQRRLSKRSNDIKKIDFGYRIQAFNHSFDLLLTEEEAFLAPSFVIQHFDENRTWLTNEVDHCFYKGFVNGDPSSTVSISLCHGLVC